MRTGRRVTVGYAPECVRRSRFLDSRGVPDLRALCRVGSRVLAERAAARLWGHRTFFVLCAELHEATAAGQAAPAMAPCDGPGFLAFAQELETARGVEYLELRWRARWCADDVRKLYVAADADSSPVYAQWLIGPHEQARPAAARHLGGTRRLAEDERILEGAYTFPRMRGRGLMRDCMAQLIDHAFAEGATRVWTYVETDNVASLRGCAAVGFSPRSLRRQVHRLGRRRVMELPLDDRAQAAWATAIATLRTQ